MRCIDADDFPIPPHGVAHAQTVLPEMSAVRRMISRRQGSPSCAGYSPRSKTISWIRVLLSASKVLYDSGTLSEMVRPPPLEAYEQKGEAFTEWLAVADDQRDRP
jgi:hypothetical protein